MNGCLKLEQLVFMSQNLDLKNTNLAPQAPGSTLPQQGSNF
jgi:hypothetical protein